MLELAPVLLELLPTRLRSNIYTCSRRLRQSAARTRICPGAFHCVSSPCFLAQNYIVIIIVIVILFLEVVFPLTFSQAASSSAMAFRFLYAEACRQRGRRLRVRITLQMGPRHDWDSGRPPGRQAKTFALEHIYM